MVNQKLKKEKMRDANKSLYFGILVLVGLSCSSIKNELIPTNNNGGYKMVSSKNDSNSSANEIYIFGNVFDVNKIGKGVYVYNLKVRSKFYNLKKLRLIQLLIDTRYCYFSSSLFKVFCCSFL